MLGTNDNEAGNDFLSPNGSQAENMEGFLHGWQVCASNKYIIRIVCLHIPVGRALPT